MPETRRNGPQMGVMSTAMVRTSLAAVGVVVVVAEGGGAVAVGEGVRGGLRRA